MPSPSIVDVNSLLEPISEDNLVGSDIREDSSPTSIYSTIKDARSAARAAERHSMFDGGSSEADGSWRKILELAPEILKNHAKDLEIASWYTEALIRKAGFQGLRDGFTLIRQLIETYWDGLYPLPDEDGIETRVSPLTGLNGEGAEGVLIAPIRSIRITEDMDPGPFSFWQYKQALDVQKISDEAARAEKAKKVGFSTEDIERAVANSSQEFFINIRDDIQICLNEFRSISRMLDEHCGTHDAPPTSNIIHTLEDSLGIINHLGKNKLPIESSEEDEMGEDDGSGQSQGQKKVGGPIKTRADAFRHLQDISQFFRTSEPHSPISYALERLVRWGDLPLHELMKELIPDHSSRDLYGSLTGVKTNDE